MADDPQPPLDAEDWLNQVLNDARKRGIEPSPSDRVHPIPPTTTTSSPSNLTTKGLLVSELRREIASIDFNAAPPDDPSEIGEVVTKARSIARRLITIILLGGNREAIESAKLIFAYMEGLPVQPVEFDVAKVVMALAQDRNLDRDDIARAISETNRIITQARNSPLL